MKRILIVLIGLIGLGLLFVVLKGRKVSRPVQMQVPVPAPTRVADPTVQALDTYLADNPADMAASQLRRLSAALKTNPPLSKSVVGEIATQSLQDGAVSPDETVMLEEAAALVERGQATEAEMIAFAAKHAPATSQIPAVPGSIAKEPSAVVKKIDSFIQKNPSGRGVAQLRRLSTAIKARPAQVQALAETAASRIQDGAISNDDATVIEKAASLAEKQGLSPREMAEFSSKYRAGAGLTQKPVSARMEPQVRTGPRLNLEGKRRLTYTFTGVARCAGDPCEDIRVIVRVTSGDWVETRRDTLGAQGNYSLQLPILSATRETVRWHLEALSKDLRKAELTGTRVTTAADQDIALQNELILRE